jgi:hypothetical protein
MNSLGLTLRFLGLLHEIDATNDGARPRVERSCAIAARQSDHGATHPHCHVD